MKGKSSGINLLKKTNIKNPTRSKIKLLFSGSENENNTKIEIKKNKRKNFWSSIISKENKKINIKENIMVRHFLNKLKNLFK